MKGDRLIAGLDLGSSKTCVVIADAVGDGRSPGAKVLGVGLARTTGVKRGVVQNIEETTRSIKLAMRDAERMAGVRAPLVFCGIAGDHVQTQLETGLEIQVPEYLKQGDRIKVDTRTGAFLSRA